MKSFGIGLALLIGGFASYFLTNALKKAANAIASIGQFLQGLANAGFLPEGVTLPEEFGPQIVSKVVGIPQSLINVAPYICLGIMAFGVAWFWLIEPILYLATPPKKEARREIEREVVVTPSVTETPRVEPGAPTGKDIRQWIAEAILEKLEREKGR